MKASKIVKSFLLCTALLGTTLPVMARESYGVHHYDHATVGERFNPHDMVTHCTLSRYNFSEGSHTDIFTYADGTQCQVLYDRKHIVHSIIVTKP